MTDYKPNSNRFKEAQAGRAPEKKVEKVVSGVVKARKKSEFEKFKEVFISKDVGSVRSYILMDVLIPSVKKAVSDIIKTGIDMLLYGESGKSKGNLPASRVSYRSYYDGREPERRDAPVQKARVGLEYNDIVFETRGDAEEVLDRMSEIIEQYGMVSVADFYELSGVPDSNHTNNNYGWTDISSTQIFRVQEGSVLKLPRAMPIK